MWKLPIFFAVCGIVNGLNLTSESSHSTDNLNASSVVVPQMTTGFKESYVQPGNSALLTCTATGNPLPKIHWYLDDTILSKSRTTSIVEKIYNSTTISSVVTISKLNVEQGGFYQCLAVNDAGSQVFVNRINVFGKLNVRKIFPRTVLSGEDIVLRCPYYGFPVEKIQWIRDGVVLPNLFRQSVDTNGNLIISYVHKALDDGVYTCEVSNGKEFASGTVTLNVLVNPTPTSPSKTSRLFENVHVIVAISLLIIVGLVVIIVGVGACYKNYRIAHFSSKM